MTQKQLQNLAKALKRYEITETYIQYYYGVKILNKVKDLNETIQTIQEVEHQILPLDD